jgi:hypothetical protein
MCRRSQPSGPATTVEGSPASSETVKVSKCAEQTAALRLEQGLLACPAAVERGSPLALRQGEQRVALGRSEVLLGDSFQIVGCVDVLDIHAEVDLATESEESEVTSMGEVEAEIAVSQNGLALLSVGEVQVARILCAGVMRQQQTQRAGAGDGLLLIRRKEQAAGALTLPWLQVCQVVVLRQAIRRAQPPDVDGVCRKRWQRSGLLPLLLGHIFSGGCHS